MVGWISIVYGNISSMFSCYGIIITESNIFPYSIHENKCAGTEPKGCFQISNNPRDFVI